MEILLATGNAHKKDELERILAPHRLLIPAEIGVEFDPEETGDTYLENALIKARDLFESSGGRPVLSDDSGLSVPAMKGAPGVYSARYGSDEAGRELESWERNALLIEKMQEFEGSRRQAFFVCCMALIIDEYRVFTAQETFDGFITHEPSGRGGFGYDPIFYVPELQKTVAELDAGEKDRISHRGRAGVRIRALIDNLDKVQ